MGINLGALFAPLICGFLAEDFFKTTVNGVVQYGFKYAFLAAAIGMIAGQLAFNLLGKRYLGDIGMKPAGKKTAANPKANEPLTKRKNNGRWPSSSSLVLSSFSGPVLNKQEAP